MDWGLYKREEGLPARRPLVESRIIGRKGRGNEKLPINLIFCKLKNSMLFSKVN
jgi:hypothetical protein